MTAKKHILLVTILSCVANTLWLVHIGFVPGHFAPSVFYVLHMLMGYFILHQLYYLKNWARILVVISSSFAVLGAFSAPISPLFLAAKKLFLGGVGIYALIALNEKSVKELYLSDKKGFKRRTWILVLTWGIVSCLLRLAGFSFEINKFWNTLQQSEIWIESIETGEKRRITHEGKNMVPRFSPDAKFVAYQHSSFEDEQSTAIRVFSFSKGEVVYSIEDPPFNFAPSWSNDTGTLFYIARDRVGGQADLWSYSLADGHKVRITNDSANENIAEWSPDGQYAVILQHKELFVLDVKSGKKKQLTDTKHHLQAPNSPVWMPDGKSIAFTSLNQIKVIDLGGRLIDVINVPDAGRIMSLQLNPTNSDEFVFPAMLMGNAREVVNLYKASLKTKEVILWKRNRPSLQLDLRMSPDGEFLIYSEPVTR